MKLPDTVEQELRELELIPPKDVSREWVMEKSRAFLRIMSYYRCAMMEIETKFRVLDQEHMLAYEWNPISSIKSRLKSLPSIEKKLIKRGLPVTLESMEHNLTDIAGVRVICPFPDDVYYLADTFLKQDDIVLLEKKDYIRNPKPNGYRSLHLVVEIPIFLTNEKRMMKAEIQLRTIAMDCWASLEHQLRYKKDLPFDERMGSELQECARLSADLDRRMDALRRDVQKLQENMP